MGTKYKVLVLLLLCVLSFGCAHKKSPAVDDAAAQYERYKALYGANGDMEGGDWDWGENDPSVSGQVLRRAPMSGEANIREVSTAPDWFSGLTGGPE